MGMIGVFLSESTIVKTSCATLVALSFVQGMINVLDLRYNLITEPPGQHQPTTRAENENPLRNFVNQNILNLPEVLTYCEVREPIWKFWKRRQVIWGEERKFDYKHCIDLSEINGDSIGNFIEEEDKIIKINFDIRFDDEGTEKSYQLHTQNLLDELRRNEFWRNCEIKTKRIIRIDQVDVEKAVVRKPSYNGVPECLWVWSLVHPIYILELFQWLIVRLDIKSLMRKVTVRKLISNRDIEVI